MVRCLRGVRCIRGEVGSVAELQGGTLLWSRFFLCSFTGRFFPGVSPSGPVTEKTVQGKPQKQTSYKLQSTPVTLEVIL